MKNIKKIPTDKFTREYKEIMDASETNIIVPVEWEENGDSFQKFSIYENYTPVETFGNTVLTSQL